MARPPNTKQRTGDITDTDHVRAKTVVTSINKVSERVPTKEACLVVIYGSDLGRKFNLDAANLVLGRSSKCDIQIDQESVSRAHTKIVNSGKSIRIRDLGSTNGTLVNGEMVTEAQLAHGARIRVGNARFVFQDPAMAEIDLELAGAGDDDDWGMMREIDLAAVRKRNPATVVYALLFVAIVGAGSYFLAVGKPPKRPGGGQDGPPGNLHPDPSFEAETVSWRGGSEGGVSVGTTAQTKRTGAQALEIRAAGPYGEAFHGERQRIDRAPYRIRGAVAARGAKARLGLLWKGAGLERWATAPGVEGGFTEVNVVLSPPPWASSALLGVRIEGDGVVNLDDVTLVREPGEPRLTEVKLNEFRVDITDDRVLDLFHSDAAILVNGRPIARDAEGRDLDASALTLHAEAQDQEHILVTVQGAAGAATTGVVLDGAGNYLRDGFRAFTPEAEKKFHPAFPDEGVLALADVRKLLLGGLGRSFAVLPTEGARLDAEARVDGKVRSVALLGPAADGRFAFRFKVDLKGENQLATRRIAEALTLDTEGRWGEFLVAASEALAAFPFANPLSRKQLSTRILAVTEAYETARTSIDRLRREYVEFKDAEDLAAAAAQLADLEARYQIKEGEGTRGQYLQEAKAEVRRFDFAAREERETKLAQHTFIQATLVDLPEGRICSAALQLYYVARFLPDSQQAPKAKAELEKLKQTHPEVIEVLEKLRFMGRG